MDRNGTNISCYYLYCTFDINLYIYYYNNYKKINVCASNITISNFNNQYKKIYCRIILSTHLKSECTSRRFVSECRTMYTTPFLTHTLCQPSGRLCVFAQLIGKRVGTFFNICQQLQVVCLLLFKRKQTHSLASVGGKVFDLSLP